MSIGQSLLPEFDMEMAKTRKMLERVPDEKLEWKAHEKSNTIGWVAKHLADIPGWVVVTLNQDSLDLDPPGGEPFQLSTANSRAEFLELFDKNVSAAREAIASTDDATLLKPWSLLNHGQVMFTMPRIAVLRNFVMNHSIHHRAHLCVYFRLNDIPVPSLYGPSADESG
jgi:uncharacterized damage-inducible protein DinB